MRSFSSAARALLAFVWKGTAADPKYEEIITKKIKSNYRLAGADKVEIAGGEHTSTADAKLRVSGQILRGDTRLTSVHAYYDGQVTYSKAAYNESQS